VDKLVADLGVESVSALRKVPVADLLAAQSAIAAAGGGSGTSGALPFFPALDGGLLSEPPLAAIRAGLNADVPLLAGTNRDEMRFFAIGDRGAFDLDEDRLLRRIERMLGDKIRGPAVDAYRSARAARGESVTPTDLWFAITSDHVFRVPVSRMAEAQSEHQAATDSYLFTWSSPVFDGALGACHALEIPFVFGQLDAPGMAVFAGSGPEAAELSRNMQEAWLAF